MIGLSQILKTGVRLPPRVLFHALEGIGKTTLSSQFPDPIYIQTEDGCPSGIEISTFGHLDNYQEVRTALGALGAEAHNYKTLVIDSLDRLEDLIWTDVCKTRGWQSIEQPGYGKGYVEADAWWIDLLKGLDWLRRERQMITVLLAHSTIESVSDPRVPSYTSYQLRLHKRARGLIQDEMDVIGFLSTDVVTHTEQLGFNKTRTRGEGGAQRWLHLEGRPAFVAKNRYNMPAKILIPKDFQFNKLSELFPIAASGDGVLRSAAKHQTNKTV